MKTTSLRKRYTPEQKAQMVVQVLKEELSLASRRVGTSEQGVHPNQLRQWKTQAVERLALVFQDDRSSLRELSRRVGKHERERTELYAEIGRLTTSRRVGIVAQKKIWYRALAERNEGPWSTGSEKPFH